jgi:hypothetical protein
MCQLKIKIHLKRSQEIKKSDVACTPVIPVLGETGES